MDNNINAPNTNNFNNQNFNNNQNMNGMPGPQPMNNYQQAGFNQSMNYGGPQPMNQGMNYNQGMMPNGSPKKTNTALIVIICVVVAVFVLSVIAFVAFTFVFGLKKGNEIINEANEKREEISEKLDKDEEIPKTKLHDFSEYENYKFTMNMVIASSGVEVTTSSNGIADVKNGTDYMETTASYAGYSSTSYSYSDYNLGYNYNSEDKINWTLEITDGTESINLDDIINKINSNDNDVTVLSDNHYSVKVDFESEDMAYNGVYADVYVTNGYISSLYYDLTSVVASEGFENLTVDIKISDFNEAGDVVIPDNVKNTNSI